MISDKWLSRLPLQTPVSSESVPSICCYCNRISTIPLLLGVPLRVSSSLPKRFRGRVYTKHLIVLGTFNHLAISCAYLCDSLYLNSFRTVFSFSPCLVWSVGKNYRPCACDAKAVYVHACLAAWNEFNAYS